MEVGVTEPTDYEKDTRIMVRDFKSDVMKKLDRVELLVTNHLMHRVPPWVTAIIATLTAIIGAIGALLI